MEGNQVAGCSAPEGCTLQISENMELSEWVLNFLSQARLENVNFCVIRLTEMYK